MGKDTKNVVLGVTGSIAAYKAAELVRLIVQKGWSVQVVMTESACRFVGEITFRTLSRRPVACRMFDDTVRWEPEHIGIADMADVFVIAPCTANVLAKIACGMADDLLTCSFLASTAPAVIAPAMNSRMWDNPATVANIEALKSRGIEVIDTDTGDLACAYTGKGRLADLDVILRVIERRMEEKQ